jgi:hypothetical protein
MRKSIQGTEREMIRMCMRQQNRVERWEICERNTRATYSRKETSKSLVEIGIGEEALVTELNEKCSMADICDAH